MFCFTFFQLTSKQSSLQTSGPNRIYNFERNVHHFCHIQHFTTQCLLLNDAMIIKEIRKSIITSAKGNESTDSASHASHVSSVVIDTSLLTGNCVVLTKSLKV